VGRIEIAGRKWIREGSGKESFGQRDRSKNKEEEKCPRRGEWRC
jgi:hypothetical protein